MITQYVILHNACIFCSVPDPFNFGPSGSPSGSVIYVYGSGSFHQQAKKWRKTLISTVLSLKNDVNVSSKRNKNKNLERKKILLASWRSLTKREGSGSVTKMSRVRNTDFSFNVPVLFLTGGSICPRTHRISSSDPASPSQTTQQEPGNIL